jgi:hypothetical protein
VRFEILELIQPALQISADLTTTYSTEAANLHRVPSDLDWAVTELRKLENNPLLTDARARSDRVAGARIRKYHINFFTMTGSIPHSLLHRIG